MLRKDKDIFQISKSEQNFSTGNSDSIITPALTKTGLPPHPPTEEAQPQQ